VSVGNLHWGGSGKTPFTIALAAHLGATGRRVAILSRGYGRVSSGVRVVSRGSGPEIAVEEAGDEPFEMARALPGVAVVVGESRAEAGRRALAELAPPPDLFLLDDGFSHRALARDIDLLLFPAADPWGGGRLLPAGRLREPLAAAARADAVVLTGADAADAAAGSALAAALAPHGFDGAGFTSAVEGGPPRIAGGAELPAGARAFAVAAIARPESFFAAARRAGCLVVGEAAFRDHARYSGADLRSIERRARQAGAELVLTTAKDLPKLDGRLAYPLAMLPIAQRPEPAFWRWLEARLARLARLAETRR
jgi:tetraacyldisaccharide 4'-kinase